MQVQKNPEDQLVDVVVADSVGASLSQHMEDTNRGTEHPVKLQQRVQMAVWKSWGTNSVKRFQDDHGGGWYTSVANALGGEDLVAIIRTIHGTRMVCAVVESDEAEHFNQTGQWLTDAARGIDPELEAEIARLEGNPPAAPGRPGRPTAPLNGAPAQHIPEATEPEPDAARLIIWWMDGPQVEGEKKTVEVNVEHTTYGEVQSKVLPLLMKGAHVEVWADPKTPEIKVSL